jgi:hypothetical protein
MRFKDEQIKRFKNVLEKEGVSFEGYTDEQAHKIAGEALEYYATLADINLRIKKEENVIKESSGGVQANLEKGV